MSMIGNLLRVPQSTLDELHATPESIVPFLYPETVNRQGKSTKGFLANLFGKNDPVPAPKSNPPTTPPSDMLDIDKSWHCLHFLLTGSDWEGDFPAGFLVSCGEPIGDVDVGYGPARSFNSMEVKQIAEWLATQNTEVVVARLDPKRMGELDIYPSIWGDDADFEMEEEQESLGQYLESITTFVRESAERNLALIVYLN